jgi:hypothetical protein
MRFKEHTKRILVATLTGLYHINVIHVAVTQVQDHAQLTR